MTRQDGRFAQSAADETLLDLRLGQPSPSLLPLAEIEAAARARLGPGNDARILQYGAAQGYEAFREALADLLRDQTGVEVSAATLATTGGISSALGLVSQILARPGDTVVCGDPTYFLARGIFESGHLNVVGIPVDADGLDVDALASRLEGGLRIAFVYVLPSFHNPCSVTLAPDRAQRLVELAQRHDFVIVADEPYVMLHFESPPPSMMSYDGGRGRVLSLGSFSKILGPGLRLGWVHAREDLVQRFVEHGVLRSGGGLNPLVSSIVHGTIDDGFLPTHIERLRQSLHRRATALSEALDAHLPDASFVRPRGGYFVWCKLPGGVDSAAILERARNEHAVGFCPGSRCAVDRDLADHVRLSFSFYDEAELPQAVQRLAAAVR